MTVASNLDPAFSILEELSIEGSLKCSIILRLRKTVPLLANENRRRRVVVLGHKDAGSRRVQVLGINTVDLVTSSEVRRLVSQPGFSIGEGNVKSDWVWVWGCHRTLLTALLNGLGG